MRSIKYFRDLYKNPDLYGEKPSPEERAEIDEYWKNKERGGIKTEVIEKFGPTAQKFYDSIELIKKAGLKTKHENDFKEKEIIENRKEVIINYAKRVLEDIKKYLSKISEIETEKQDNYRDKALYLKFLTSSDEERKIYHNRLITDLKVLIRLINVNFNADISDDHRLNLEVKMKDRAGLSKEQLADLMNKREYFNFPSKEGVFVNLKEVSKNPEMERDFIANWALNMYHDLTYLEKKINDDIIKNS